MKLVINYLKMIMMIVDEIFIPKRRIVIVNPEQIQHYISVYNGKKNIY